MHGEKAGSTKSYSRGGGARTVILGVEALLGELRRLRRSTVVRHEPGLIGVGVDGDAARLADRRARVRAAPLEARPLCGWQRHHSPRTAQRKTFKWCALFWASTQLMHGCRCTRTSHSRTRTRARTTYYQHALHPNPQCMSQNGVAVPLTVFRVSLKRVKD